MRPETRLRAALGLNLVIVAVQVAFGLVAHSLGLLADAGHNLTDVAALILSLVAVNWAKRAPTQGKTFGYHRGTVLAAQVNAATLIATMALIAYEAARRLLHPRPVTGGLVIVAALIALVANGAAGALLHGHDLNMRSARLHMAGDAVASLGVAGAGIIIAATNGTYWIDPVVSLAIGVLIAAEAIKLLRQTADVLLEGTPAGLDLDDLARTIVSVNGVDEVHDLHVWGLTEDVRVLSAHIILSGHPSLEEAQVVGNAVKRALVPSFGIRHATLELECEGCVDDGAWCSIDTITATDAGAAGRS